MREIGSGLDGAKSTVRGLLGMPVVIKVNMGRGKSTLLSGSVEATFPAVFSFRLDSGELKTFSYSDVHTKGVMFINKQN